MSSVFSGALRLSARGPVTPDEVWERYTRPSLWTGWAPHMREVDYSRPVVTPGTTGRVTGIGGVTADFRIDALDEAARTWAWSVRSGPLRLVFEHGVNAVPSSASGESEAWLVVHGLWPVILGYAPIARFSLGRLVTPR